MEGQAANDFAAFAAPPPEVAAAMAKEREKKLKEMEKREAKVKPEQMKMAKELADQVKEEAEAEVKSKLIQQLTDYIRIVKEYHPDRAQFLRVPKNFGPKNSVDELRVWIADVKQELNKRGGLSTVKMLWVEGFKAWEKMNDGERFGLKMYGIGQIAENSVRDRQMQDGSVVCGPAVPTLAEWAVEHANWFSTGVDMRLAMMAFEMVAGVHRMNSEMTGEQNPINTKASEESEDLMKEI